MGFNVSDTAITPCTRPAQPTITAVRPRARAAAYASRNSSLTLSPSPSNSSTRPTTTEVSDAELAPAS